MLLMSQVWLLLPPPQTKRFEDILVPVRSVPCSSLSTSLTSASYRSSESKIRDRFRPRPSISRDVLIALGRTDLLAAFVDESSWLPPRVSQSLPSSISPVNRLLPAERHELTHLVAHNPTLPSAMPSPETFMALNLTTGPGASNELGSGSQFNSPFQAVSTMNASDSIERNETDSGVDTHSTLTFPVPQPDDALHRTTTPTSINVMRGVKRKREDPSHVASPQSNGREFGDPDQSNVGVPDPKSPMKHSLGVSTETIPPIFPRQSSTNSKEFVNLGNSDSTMAESPAKLVQLPLTTSPVQGDNLIPNDPSTRSPILSSLKETEIAAPSTFERPLVTSSSPKNSPHRIKVTVTPGSVMGSDTSSPPVERPPLFLQSEDSESTHSASPGLPSSPAQSSFAPVVPAGYTDGTPSTRLALMAPTFKPLDLRPLTIRSSTGFSSRAVRYGHPESASHPDSGQSTDSALNNFFHRVRPHPYVEITMWPRHRSE